MRPEIQAWAKENIIWAGGPQTKKSSRYNYKPIIIVDHISEGTLGSMDSWFNNPKAYGSAHFGVGRDGTVHQYVRIEDAAWANGLTSGSSHCTSEAVKNMGYVNPNRYTVSIEHAGVYSETRGELTPAQLESTLYLHAYIIDYVLDKYNEIIWVNRDRIIGHYEIDNKQRPNCPGELFPFNTIISRLGGDIGEELPFTDISDHWVKNDALRALKLGLITGDGSDLLKPDRPCTRAEQIAMIMNLYDLIDSKFSLD